MALRELGESPWNSDGEGCARPSVSYDTELKPGASCAQGEPSMRKTMLATVGAFALAAIAYPYVASGEC